MKAALALNPPRIWRIKLPKTFSLSWLSNSVADFRVLLLHFAPEIYRKVRPGTQLMAYEHLLKWLDERAPIDACGALDWEMEMLGGGGELGSGGIPVILYGYDNYEDNSPARAFLTLWLNGYKNSGNEFHGISELIASLPKPPKNYDNLPKPPEGRRWIAPWDGLIDFAQWITASTGWGVLDFSDGDVDGMPQWNIDEIQSLIDDWSECRAILNRKDAFNTWVDENPQERLPQMAHALLGDKATIEAITEPIP